MDAMIIQRVLEKKDQILTSSHAIIDFIENVPFTNDQIQQIKKEIVTISHCLSELKPHAGFSDKNRFSSLSRASDMLMVKLDSANRRQDWEREIFCYKLKLDLDIFCITVNSIEATPTKKSIRTRVGLDFGKMKASISKDTSNF